MDVRGGTQRKLNIEELMLLNCGVGEYSLRVLWTARRSNQSILKEISPDYSLEGLDTEAEAPIFRPPNAKNWLIGNDPDAWKDWRQEEKGTTGDGWMASPTWWTWVWASCRSWWWTGKSGMLQSLGSQKVGHEWATELEYISPNSEQLLCMVLTQFLRTCREKWIGLIIFWPIILAKILSVFQLPSAEN